jgi:hypothetical protein
MTVEAVSLKIYIIKKCIADHKDGQCILYRLKAFNYFAKLIARVSRITVIFTCPG